MPGWLRAASIVALAWACGVRAGPVLDLPAAPHNAVQVREVATRLVASRIAGIREARLDGCARHCGRLERVFERVAEVAREQAQRPLPLRLTVVRDAGTEAFSAPGGEIVISECFVDDHALTDAELAFVLAHEIMHVLLHHEAHAMALVAGVSPAGRTRALADLYDDLESDLGLVLKLAPTLHDHEFEADWHGLLLAALAGFDPGAQAGLLHKLAALDAPGLQLTHPAASRRLARIEGMMPIARRVHALARDGGAAPASGGAAPMAARATH